MLRLSSKFVFLLYILIGLTCIGMYGVFQISPHFVQRIRKILYWTGQPHFQPGSTSPIFFVETSGKSHLEIREACAIESAANLHPRRNITLYGIGQFAIFDVYIGTLKRIPNIRVELLNLTSLFHGTPLESWHSRQTIRESDFPTEHLSDAIRLALLWKNGGVYFDTDVVSMRPIDGLTNSVGLQQKEEVNGAVLIFDQWSSFLYECMDDYVAKFSGVEWGNQGPNLITRMLRKSCGNIEFLSDVIRDPDSCKGISLLPEYAFYPIPWPSYATLFEPMDTLDVDIGNSYTVHLWGKLSREIKGKPGSGVLMDHLAKNYCPLIYKWMLKKDAL